MLARIISRIPALCSPFIIMIQKIRYHRKDFLCHEGCFIIAHPLCYCRTSLEENRHLERMPVWVTNIVNTLASRHRVTFKEGTNVTKQPTDSNGHDVGKPRC